MSSPFRPLNPFEYLGQLSCFREQVRHDYATAQALFSERELAFDKHAAKALQALSDAGQALDEAIKKAHSAALAEETQRDPVGVLQRSIDMANCTKVGQEKPYPREVKLRQETSHLVEVSEKGKL